MENEVIKLLGKRKSTRAFTGEKISAEKRQLILNAAFRAPTAGNQQLYTVIEVTDKCVRKKLSELCDDQPFINNADMCLVFLADCRRWLRAYRMAGCDPRAPGVGDLLLAFMDSLVAAQSAAIAAESLGIGSCYIGDVLENREGMKELLALPDEVVPAAMLVFGYPTEQQKLRPNPDRLPENAVVFENRYRDLSENELRQAFRTRSGDPNFDFDSYMRAFDKRKYDSDFSREMSRSAAEYVRYFITEGII